MKKIMRFLGASTLLFGVLLLVAEPSEEGVYFLLLIGSKLAGGVCALLGGILFRKSYTEAEWAEKWRDNEA